MNTKLKIGDNVRIVHNADPKGFPSKSKYIGETFAITKLAKDYPRGIGIWDDSKTDDVCYYVWYEDELELVPQFAVGTKVTCVDGSYSMEFTNGSPKMSGDIRFDTKMTPYIYEITAVGAKLPANLSTSQTNDTIIRRISDSKVFFVQQRFLREYVAVPKFKRGDWVVYGGDQYYRVVSSKVKDNNVIYEISPYQSTFMNNREGYGTKVNEGELKEVQ